MAKNSGAEPAQGGKRGRSREVAGRSPGESAERTILAAAHRLLLRAGTKGLSLTAVAKEARVDVSAVTGRFGSRQGLIEALMDELYADPAAGLAEVTASLPSLDERWRAYLSQVRRNHADHEATEAYFDLVAVALRDPALRARLGRHNKAAARTFGEVLGTDSAALAELLVAAVDGIELHRALAGDDYPAEEVLSLLERMARTEFRS
ncbi:TetR/AcrR family transcriptional regulator [Paractinoplanes durhamensis]|uniref:HTH tetR-type domain-containing protein n=1 Tax=Paractinoplanes durhamensis TaxID=113563 RepID=A0ABQ3YWA7_9ACTN|nr:TetR/AcrR family transcriptional regulator [Actinoplanes durhamensis]GIE01875.1 hypothetical protein Adu01nite_32250 [Actinoplanes durhamensis]